MLVLVVRQTLGAAPGIADHLVHRMQRGERQVASPQRHAKRHDPLAKTAQQTRQIVARQTLLHDPVADRGDLADVSSMLGGWHRICSHGRAAVRRLCPCQVSPS
jgi:hypothetical protein